MHIFIRNHPTLGVAEYGARAEVTPETIKADYDRKTIAVEAHTGRILLTFEELSLLSAHAVPTPKAPTKETKK